MHETKDVTYSPDLGHGSASPRPAWRLLISRPRGQEEAERALKMAALWLAATPLAKELVLVFAGAQPYGSIVGFLLAIEITVLSLLVWWKRSLGIAAGMTIVYGGSLLFALDIRDFDASRAAYYASVFWMGVVAWRTLEKLSSVAPRPTPRPGTALRGGLTGLAAFVACMLVSGNMLPEESYTRTRTFRPGDALPPNFMVVVETPPASGGAPALHVVYGSQLQDFLAQHRGATVHLSKMEAKWDNSEPSVRVSYRMTSLLPGAHEVTVRWWDGDNWTQATYEVAGSRVIPKTLKQHSWMVVGYLAIQISLLFALIAYLALRPRAS